VLLVVAAVTWLLTFVGLWGPYYLFGAEGQLYLYPLALIVEAAVEVVAVIALALAIVAAARRVIGPAQATIVIAGAVALIVLGPVLLFFGNFAGPAMGR
jgi:hypothetical protein